VIATHDFLIFDFRCALLTCQEQDAHVRRHLRFWIQLNIVVSVRGCLVRTGQENGNTSATLHAGRVFDALDPDIERLFRVCFDTKRRTHVVVLRAVVGGLLVSNPSAALILFLRLGLIIRLNLFLFLRFLFSFFLSATCR